MPTKIRARTMLNINFNIAALVFIGFVLSACAAQQAHSTVNQNAEAQAIEKKAVKEQPIIVNQTINTGRELYFKKGCDVCHSYEGQGWSGGKRLAEPVLPLAAFKLLTRRPNGAMPAYSQNVLSDAELEAIHQYLGSLRSPDAKDIPLLRRND